MSTTSAQLPDSTAATRQDATVEKEWPTWARPVLEVVRRNVSVAAAAETVGVHRATVYRLRGRDAAFSEALDDAREAALDRLEERLYLAATEGIPNRTTTTKRYPDGTVETTVKESVSFYPTAAMFLLKRWRPEYRESYRVEATGSDGGPIEVDSLERIDAQMALLVDELRRRGRTIEPQDLDDPKPADGAGDGY